MIKSTTTTTLDGYLAQVQQIQRSNDPSRLITLISFDTRSDQLQRLSHILNNTPNLRPASYTSLTRSYFSDYRPFADLIAAYLLFCRDVDPSLNDDDDDDHDHENDEERTLNAAYSLLEDCYRQADKVFTQGDTAWFVPILRELTSTIVDIALRAGRCTNDTQLIKAGEAARLISRPMGVAASDRSNETPSKRSALFFLVNATFRVYFAMHNLRLCDTILSNTSNAVGGSFSEERYYPKSDRVMFAYYRGRVWLYQRRLPLARNELKKALGLIDQGQSWGNTRLILIYLITASLPLGIFPSIDLLQEYDLDDQFESLLIALTNGNFVNVLGELDRHCQWHLAKGNYLLLKEKLEVICWRNLIRKTLLIISNGAPLPPTGPLTLSLEALLTTAKIAFGDDELDLDDVEGVCTSLMEQGYLKAYIMHSKRVLVLQKSSTFGFPPISTVHP